MNLKDVVLKGFPLSNCAMKTKCFAVKALRKSRHPSTDGRIKMQRGNTEKVADRIKIETIPLGGWCSKTLAQSPIHTSSCPEALREKQSCSG